MFNLSYLSKSTMALSAIRSTRCLRTVSEALTALFGVLGLVVEPQQHGTDQYGAQHATPPLKLDAF